METITTEDTDLDEHQRRVVGHDGGPLLVLGGPGTGKSTVLVERWLRLGTEVTQPHRVLMLVNARERALALRDRLPWLLPQRAIVEVPVHTWHAFAYHLVTRYYRRLGYAHPPVLLTASEQWAVVRDLLSSENTDAWGPYADTLTTHAFVDEVCDFCIRAGQRVASTEELEALGADRPVVGFAIRYREHLRETSRLDYAGLVGAAANLLAEDDDIAQAVRRRFTHVLVDDAHDLAPVQLRLLRQLALDGLVCAGDPDSAIEGFRGSDPGWLGRFEELVPGHEKIVLPVCHRYGAAVGEVARRLISHGEPDGAHRPAEFAAPDDAVADVRCYSTLADEIEAAARAVRAAHLADGIPYERMAILLAQPSTYLAPLRRSLESLSVPYRLAARDRPLETEPAVRAVLDLCRFALGDGGSGGRSERSAEVHSATGPADGDKARSERAPRDNDDELVVGLLASPLVGADPHRIRELRREAYIRGAPLASLARGESEELSRLAGLVGAHPDESADATFFRIFEASSWCQEQAARRGEDPEAAHHMDALVALSRALGRYVERQRGGTMRTYLETSAHAGFASESPGRGRGVEVMSLHASRGLEWDVVCVLGVAEGQIPKSQRGQGLFDPWAAELGSAADRWLAHIAQERRTLYVALTRARRRLAVSCSPGPRRAAPSRFLEEAFGRVPEPQGAVADRPLTVPEAEAWLRRTLASRETSGAEKAAAAAALARVPADPRTWWWRRGLTPGAPLTPDGLLTTSYSRLGKYDNCPLQYVLESVLGLDPSSTYQMKFGSLIHKIIERSDPTSGDITELEQALALYKEEFVARHKDDYPNLVFARTYYSAGRRMIARWWHTERDRDETVAVEYSFDDLDVDGHTIRGRIDRVARRANGLVLSDYKTSSSMADKQEVAESLQLAIYYLAAVTRDDLRAAGQPVLMQLVYPGIERTNWEDGSKDCGRRVQKPDEARAAVEKLRGILGDAAAERFDPSPTADCRWCLMKPLCPRHPEGREVPP